MVLHKILSSLFTLVLLFCISINSSAAGPDIEPQFDADKPMTNLEALNFKVISGIPFPSLVQEISLKDSDGSPVEPVSYEWDAKCPDGFSPTNGADGLCERVTVVQAELQCPSGWTFIDDGSTTPLCQLKQVTPANPACPAGYSLNDAANLCEKYVEEPAQPTCESGWSRLGDTCTRTVTVDPESTCPTGFQQEAESCIKVEQQPASYGCPPGSEQQGEQCVVLDTMPGVQCPLEGSSYQPAWYSTPESCSYQPYHEIPGDKTPQPIYGCPSGYSEGSDGKCRRTTLIYCPSGMVKGGGFYVSSYQCQTTREYSTSRAALSAAKGQQKSTACLDNGWFSCNGATRWLGTSYGYCPSGYRHVKDYTCESNATAAKVIEGYTCGSGYFSDETYYAKTASCVKKKGPVNPGCPTGYTQDASMNANTDWQNPDFCRREVLAGNSSQCPEGYELHAGGAVCGKLVFDDPGLECPAGYQMDTSRNECISSETTKVNIICPDGYSAQKGSTQCSKLEVSTPESCPAGMTDLGSRCERRTVTAIKTRLTCPLVNSESTFPMYCSIRWDGGQANYGSPLDVNLDAEALINRCASQTGGLGQYTSITTSTQCAVWYDQGEGLAPPNGPSGGSLHVTSSEKAPIESFEYCSTGIKEGGVCANYDYTYKCPGGKFVGGECQFETTAPATKSCPAGYYLSGNECRLNLSNAPNEVCDSGWNYSNGQCWQIDSKPYSGTGSCSAGYEPMGGSCVKTQEESLTVNCPDSFTLEGARCVASESWPADYLCAPGWNLNNTTCWKTLEEPSYSACADGSWVLKGDSCEKVETDSVARVCPVGYQSSETNPTECFMVQAAGQVQDETIRVSIPKVWPGSYTLSISVDDGLDNNTVEQFDLLYAPTLFSSRSSDTISIPSLAHAFHWSDGADTFVTEPIRIEGNLLEEVRPVYAGVRRDAGTALYVNDILVAPGEYKQVHSGYDFELMGSVLELPVYPAENGNATVSDMVVSIGGEGDLASVLSVNAWIYSGGITKSRQSPTRIFEEVTIGAVAGSDVGCYLEANSDKAQNASVLENALCLIEWENIPSPMMASVSGEPQLKGPVDNEGEMNFGYEAYLIDNDGTKFKVGEVDGQIHGGSAMGIVDYDFENDLSTVYHTVQDIRMSLKQTDGPNCRLTVDEEYAKSFATRGSRVKFCYLEWEHLPGTLEQEPQSISPEARGRVFYAGQYQASFKVYAYTSIGTPVLVQDKMIQFEAVDPPAPSVETVGGEEITSNLFPVAARGGKVLDVKVTAENASLRVTEFLEGSVVEEDVFPALPWQDKFRNYQRIALDQSPLWTRSTHEVDAQYTDLPDVRGNVIFDSLSVPGDEVRPILSTEGRVALNDDVLTMNVGIRDIYNQDLGYDASTMGEWDVRVVQQETYETNTPITDWSSIDAEGNATLPLNLQELDINSGVLRLYAEARVKSPVPQYSKTVTSSQPVTITVLYGGQIDAELDARYIAGEAPFRTVFKVELSNRDLYSALGDVEWYISDENQQNWEKLENTNRNPRVFDYTFEEGIYFVKAKLLNRNSEAQTETPPLKVISYNKPTLEVDGPSVVFVGDKVDLQASVGFDGQSLQPDNVVIQWSEDGGDSWQDGGFDYTLTREGDEVGRVRLYTRARMPNAPADDRNAWTDNKGSVEFRTVRPPRTYIYGPRVAEVGKEHKYEVYLGLPYARMDYDVKGFFTMPDGTIIHGETAYFTPTREQLADTYAFVKYTAYIEGWREQGAEQVRDQRIRLWEYKFPEFQMSGRYSATVAPAEGTLYVRPLDFRGRLENPVYTWDFPAGVTVVEDRNPIARKVMFNEPGTYPVKVTITDDRGNEAIVEERLTFGEPEPYNADFVIGGDRTHIRAPYEILVKPNVSGGHPRDYIVDRKYFLNGELMDSYGSYGQAVLDAGTSTIRMDVTSKFGETASKVKKFTVNENQPPVCMLENYDRLGSWMLRADCSDPDGNVKTHSWWINGQKVSLSGYRISIPKDNENAIEVQLSALDDSGDESDKTTLTIEPPEDPPQP
ncbi:hypothetical protein LCGC14_0799570 [marine sediment metagenome]|uniref:PKD domain-containing protein n=1 Tax=marine sediment metagenome TaxID=412755 RepID=A0A0F9PQ19_9ZZZZ